MRFCPRLQLVSRLLPGIAVLIGIAGVARVVSSISSFVQPLIVAIFIGVVVKNTTGVSNWAMSGLKQHKLFLQTGIVLLGAQMALDELIQTGPLIVGLALTVVVFGVLYLEALAHGVFRLDNKTSSLLASGASICGVSAVVAVGESIDVDEIDITYVVGTILLFDAVTLVIFPILGQLLDLSAKSFGIWIGLTLFSTGPTTAVGFSVSEVAGQWATVTKLIRNSFIGVFAIGYTFRYARGGDNGPRYKDIWQQFPKFLVGFVLLALIANMGLLQEAEIRSIDVLSSALFLLAFAGLGFEIDLEEVHSIGFQPIVLVLIHLVTVCVLTLAAINLLL